MIEEKLGRLHGMHDCASILLPKKLRKLLCKWVKEKNTRERWGGKRCKKYWSLPSHSFIYTREKRLKHDPNSKLTIRKMKNGKSVQKLNHFISWAIWRRVNALKCTHSRLLVRIYVSKSSVLVWNLHKVSYCLSRIFIIRAQIGWANTYRWRHHFPTEPTKHTHTHTLPCIFDWIRVLIIFCKKSVMEQDRVSKSAAADA